MDKELERILENNRVLAALETLYSFDLGKHYKHPDKAIQRFIRKELRTPKAKIEFIKNLLEEIIEK